MPETAGSLLVVHEDVLEVPDGEEVLLGGVAALALLGTLEGAGKER